MNRSRFDNLRQELHKAGTTELFMNVDNEDVQDIWKQKQQLLAEMNTAIMESTLKIQQEYAQRLRDIDLEYAMYLQLCMPRGNQS